MPLAARGPGHPRRLTDAAAANTPNGSSPEVRLVFQGVVRATVLSVVSALLLGLGACTIPSALPGPEAASAPSAAVRPSDFPVAAPAASEPGDSSPEAASGFRLRRFPVARQQAVVAAHPLAAEAGLAMLRAGGSAIDAAVAVQMVLGLVEPQSSGLGGGAFLMHFDGVRTQAYDGRETAPAGADEQLFLGPDGKALPFPAAVVGGRSVGVPGAIRMLEMAHRAHGKLPWAQLIQPAIALAENGFPVGRRLHTLLAGDPALKRDPVAAAYFYRPDGTPWPEGTLLRNPALAHVLRLVAEQGANALHRGPVADAIVAKVRGHAGNPGTLAAPDLASYKPIERAALCTNWKPLERALRICGFPPPSSGAIAVAQILGMLQSVSAPPVPLDTPTADAAKSPSPSVALLHLYAEASRLAFADRAFYIGDPDFVAPPAGRWDSLLDESYLRQRARLIGSRAMEMAPPGRPSGVRLAYAADQSPELPSTSQVSVVDSEGRAAAMTTTIENQFGSRLMVSPWNERGGFLLNNELTDFSFVPRENGKPVANRVEPGKRPRSAMSPTFVFDAATGELLAAGGSAGGPFIIHHVARMLLGTLEWGLDATQAAALPNFGSVGGPLLLEAGRFPEATVRALRQRGHRVEETDITSGVHWLARRPDGAWEGAADPRREGAMAGD